MAFEITGLDHVQIAIPKDGEDKARAFEFYLKSGSGKAFANKRFW